MSSGNIAESHTAAAGLAAIRQDQASKVTKGGLARIVLSEHRGAQPMRQSPRRRPGPGRPRGIIHRGAPQNCPYSALYTDSTSPVQVESSGKIRFTAHPLSHRKPDSSGEWGKDECDVLADGFVVKSIESIMKAARRGAGEVTWLRTLGTWR